MANPVDSITVPDLRVEYDSGVESSRNESLAASNVDLSDFEHDAAKTEYAQPNVVSPSKTDRSRQWLARALDRFRRRRDAFLRNSLFGRPISVGCWPRVDGRCTYTELCLFVGLLLGTGYLCAHAVCVNRPQLPRRAAEAALVFTLALATHNSVFNLLLGLPFDRRLFWHKLFALLATALGCTHGVLAACKWGLLCRPDSDAACLRMMWSGLVLCVVLALLLGCAAPPAIRRLCWNAFYAVHLLLTVVALAAAAAHRCYYLGIGVFLWIGDVFVRYVYMAALAHPHRAQVDALPANVTRLTLPRPRHFHYEAGQYVFVMLPELSLFEWHPFSISSSPHSNLLTLHIKVLGDWTGRLQRLARAKATTAAEADDAEGLRHVPSVVVYIEGPYGTPQVDIFGKKYKSVLLIGAGIGITPLQSVANHLLHEHRTGRRHMERVHPFEQTVEEDTSGKHIRLQIRLVWCTSDADMIDAVFEADRQWAGYLNEHRDGLLAPAEPGLRLPGKRTQSRASVYPAAGPVRRQSAPASTTASLAHAMSLNDCSPVLRADLHLTRVSQQPGKEQQWPDKLRQHIRYGRPDFAQLLATMRSEAQRAGCTRVAVLCCGPNALISTVRSLVARYNADPTRNPRVQLDFHEEKFDF